ncbi:hypothetical protein DU508_06435 [Pedobacter chinensis]|uniref:Type IX secretion system membrane protein PorP/SprF n=1 Tax=Pedobacter chinensis TaxID=2282421 RepID=A0A369Q1F5_9SPHI|nr:hypothetical protein [Pedobacter chinensis]RDC56836.1 hypothetical protein DU508_06435 [Pedobacter chinensis]
MKRILILALLWAGSILNVHSQELYVFTEPASNMPTKSIGARLTNEGMFNNPGFVSRTIPEVMIGFNKNLMMHAQAFLSDMDGQYRLEGGSLYGKYRFLSLDNVQSHFRAAAFGRISTSKRPTFTRDINLEGDNSGIQGGLIFTQLLHKLALSATLGYAHAFNDSEKQRAGMPEPNNMLSYSLSSGYLVLPVVYKDYRQPNFNVYFELLGKTDPGSGQSYLDLAPAIQMILNSTTRIDLGYRFQAAGNIANRYTKNMYLIRAEFNFFNVLK